MNAHVAVLVVVCSLLVSTNSAAQSKTEICSCTGRGGVDGVTLWGPKGEACGGMITGDTKPWGTYSSSCRAPQQIGKCAGEGGVKGLELWGPPGEVCGGLWENKAKYTVGKRSAADVRLCSCKGHGGVEGVTMWGPEGDYCAGIPDDSRWGTYNADCR